MSSGCTLDSMLGVKKEVTTGFGRGRRLRAGQQADLSGVGRRGLGLLLFEAGLEDAFNSSGPGLMRLGRQGPWMGSTLSELGPAFQSFCQTQGLPGATGRSVFPEE